MGLKYLFSDFIKVLKKLQIQTEELETFNTHHNFLELIELV